MVTSSDLKGIHEFESGSKVLRSQKKMKDRFWIVPTVETFPRLRLHETDVLKILRVEAMNLWIPSSLMDISGKCLRLSIDRWCPFWCLLFIIHPHPQSFHILSPEPLGPPPQAHVTLATQAKLQFARCAAHSESAAPWADLRDTVTRDSWHVLLLFPSACSTSTKKDHSQFGVSGSHILQLGKENMLYLLFADFILG